jgi:hypothetical protein
MLSLKLLKNDSYGGRHMCWLNRIDSHSHRPQLTCRTSWRDHHWRECSQTNPCWSVYVNSETSDCCRLIRCNDQDISIVSLYYGTDVKLPISITIVIVCQQVLIRKGGMKRSSIETPVGIHGTSTCQSIDVWTENSNTERLIIIIWVTITIWTREDKITRRQRAEIYRRH